MSLASRLSLFFLASLAVVLVGFSAALYILGRSYLTRQVDQRLEKALDALEDAVAVDSDGLEWEPRDRRLSLGMDTRLEDIRWIVQDGRGAEIDRSPDARGEGFPPPIAPGSLAIPPGNETAHADVAGWRLARHHLQLKELLRQMARSPEEIDEDGYEELLLTVGVSIAPMEAGLRMLGLALIAIPAALWLLCAAAGRWLCRRALAPLDRMAAHARELAATDHPGGLPVPRTGDELEELGRAFNELLGHREEALERQRRFAGDASHQLRTPLAGLLGFIEVVRRRPRPAEEYEQTLDRVHREAGRLSQIVESLLFLARADAEAACPECEPIDLGSWLPGVLDAWSSHARAADLRVEIADPSPVAGAHPPLLSQAIGNLVDNALKYSEPGSPVTVSCRRDSATVLVAIEDRGCGMTPEEASAAFEPFYRSPRARKLGRSGVGLGLAVVRRIVAASGGTIAVESEPGRGSRFLLRLPAAEAATGDAVPIPPCAVRAST
ncbi:Sensor kinase CusS [Aquisphaera giovannonii]|uniref:histidine kinase n=1 Tax=Aquisphaera giovannonii TaxID=406548 RepID=A0A5B9WC05_9BACT|nr:ATP-binding protein [Aquisphaera giovannonii]QEH37759.1 Sensor kinase CusS [Aquisphaera giovannonii]